MRVAVVAPSPVPLRAGGAERLWTGLVDHLGQAGHAVELVKLPVREYTLPDLVAGYRQFADLDLSHVDLVISGKYPAWMVEHPEPRRLHAPSPPRALRPVSRRSTSSMRSFPGTRALDRIQALVGGKSGASPTSTSSSVSCTGPWTSWVRITRRSPYPDRWPAPSSSSSIASALHPRRIRRHLAISHQVAERAGYFPSGVDVGVVYPPPGLDPGPSPVPSTDGDRSICCRWADSRP